MEESPAFEDVYTFDKILGEGFFGRVKKAIKKDTGEAYAVKIIYKDSFETEDIPALQEEFKILTEIDHPNIVELYEIYEDDNYFYMVLELMRGEQLFQKIVEADNFSERQAADIILQIIHTLHYCHDLNVTHRDLKPENLLYASKDPGASIKISNFGLTKIIFDFYMTTMSESPGHLAPEIIIGKGQDKAVDYWSVGFILYIMLCGFSPFESENNNDLFDSIVQGKYDFPSPEWDSISNEAKDLIKGLLTIDPYKRLNYETAIQHPWLNGKSSESSIPDIQMKIKKYLVSKEFKKFYQPILKADCFTKNKNH